MRWFQNLPQTSRRIWKERRGPALAGGALLALAAVLVLGWIIADYQGEHELIKVLRTRSEALQRAETQGAVETAKDGSTQLNKTIDEWAEIASKRLLTSEEYEAATRDLYVLVGSDKYYIGPQTAEAIMVTQSSNPQNMRKFDRQRYDEYKAHFQRMLDRGAVFQDTWDIVHYGGSLMKKIKSAYTTRFTKDVFEMHGVAEGSWAELEEAIIEHELKTWPITKAQFDRSFKTDESTINVALDPKTGAIAMAVVGKSKKFTPAEKYNISRHGIAPEGYRLRFVKDIWNNEALPPDKVPFFNEREYVQKLSDAKLSDILVDIPTFLSSPEAQEESVVMWMSLVDRYDAALNELASRGYVPEPFAGRQPSAPSPSGVAHSAAPPDMAPAPEPPVEQREPTTPPVEARDEAALAEAEKRRRVAEAFLDALEKEAEKAKITPADRSLIAARLRELRLLRNPDLLKPPAPSAPPASPSDEEDEE